MYRMHVHRNSTLKRLAAVLLAISALLTLVPSQAYAASPAPAAWGTPQYANFVGSLIAPDDSIVQARLRSIAPTQDTSHFAQNLLSVYQAVSSLPLPDQTSESNLYGPDWMSASEIIQANEGDCKNHAILLATLIEALYKNTFGDLPNDLAWVRGGIVQGGGGHVWVLLNVDEIRSVSPDAFNMIASSKPSKDQTQVPVGPEPPWGQVMVWVNINFASLQDTWQGLFPQSILQLGTLYIELEATWHLPIGEFYYKKYPYVELHDRWNSFQYLTELTGTAPSSGNLQLSSSVWHYGDSISWFAAGLTPNAPVTPRIQGPWGTLQLPDIMTDLSGRAWSTFNVGTSILGAGHFIIIDKTSNTFLMQDYSLQALQSNPTSPFSLQMSSMTWHYGDVISWTAWGASADGAVAVKIEGSWGTLQLWDAVADATGKVGYDFTVDTNIPGSGQFILVDKPSGKIVQAAYTLQSQPASPSLQLSSSVWHYGDVITWSAQGLTANAVIQVMIQAPWGTIRFQETVASSSGRASFSFKVGSNILGSGQFVIIDNSSNIILSAGYALVQ